MKLRPLAPSHRLAQDLLAFARRLRRLNLLDTLELRPASPPSSTVVIIADGAPDNRAVLLVAHALDGTQGKTIDLAFPEYKGFAIFMRLHEYALQGYTRILVVIDQEANNLIDMREALQNQIQGRLYGLSVDLSGRLLLAELRIDQPPRTAHLAIAINGIDDDRFTKHTIEDHLLLAAESLGLYRIENPTDPKQAWRRLTREQRQRVYEALARDRQLTRETFKQQTAALQHLIREDENP